MKSTSLCLLLLGLVLHTGWAGEKIVITEWAKQNKAIPISLSGFSGETETVLKFDLAVQGFEIATPDQASYQVTGSNSGHVEGRLMDTVAKLPIFSKAYSTANLRVQAHALADDIVEAITGAKGISRSKIAFKQEKVAGAGEICIADFDGHNVEPVTTDGSIVAAPTWFPGRRMLFYTSYKLGNPDILSQNLGTGERTVVAQHSGLNTSAAISPDGRHLAMILSKNGSPNVWVANTDGTNLKQLTTSREGDSSPCWSPDSRTVCYSSRATGKLHLVSIEGGPSRRLSIGVVRNATEPDWSPDGQTIVFTSQMGGGVFQICTVSASGGEATVITAGEDPSWAPNSRTVVFALRSGNNNKRILSMLDAPTKRVRQLVSLSGSCSMPSWSK